MKNRSKILMVILPVLACFAFLPGAQAQGSHPPDGCYPNFTTREGCNALNILTTGAGNTALGWFALSSNTDASFNTAVGAGALDLNDGSSSTAVGAAALLLNTTGADNTAVGTDAMVFNDSGADNTAIGTFALSNNISGSNNVCVGSSSGSAIATGSNIITIGPLTGVHSIFGEESNTTYIANILNASVDGGTAQSVFVDADGRLGTVRVSAGPQAGVSNPATPKANAEAQAIVNSKIQKLQATVTKQQKQIESLTAQLREQAAQIQKVSAQLEMSKPAAKVVVNKP